MANWDLYTKKLNINGESIREREINLMKENIMSGFSQNPSYRLAYFNDLEEPKEIQVVETNKDSVVEIIMLPEDELKTGDILSFDDEKWLCFSVNKNNPVERYGKSHLCNNILNIYDESSVLFEIHCVILDEVRFYDLSASDSKYFSTPDSKIICMVSDTELTRENIKRNNIYNFSGDSYEILDMNRVIKSGLIIMKLKWSAEPQFIPETPIPSEPLEEGTYYEILGDSEIRFNQIKTYEAKKYTVDSEGDIHIDSGAKFDFEILGNTPESAYELTILSDNECNIKCKQSPYNITLKATDEDDPEGIAEIDIHLANLF